MNLDESSTSDNEEENESRNAAMIVLSTMVNNATIESSANSSTHSVENSEREPTEYDKTRAAKHEYLGTDLEEVRGRTLHDEGSILWLPILAELTVALVPGQTLPLTLVYRPTIALFQKIISKDKTFGVVCSRKLGQCGTTAEIFQYQEDNDLGEFKIIARGRQRFKLIELRYQAPGILLGKVQILPEITLPSPLHCSRFTCLDSYRSNVSMKSKINFIDAAPTCWPAWVYQQYETSNLITKVTEELKSFKEDICSSGLPTNASDFSYWVAQCVPMQDINKVRMLSFNTAIERLQFALTLLSECQKFYCSYCGNFIADRKDVFSMSTDGPQGVYCNRRGYVHELITVYVGMGMTLLGDSPSTDYSWFPGYGWTIAHCSNCRSHMGWLFTAMNNHLKPMKFWGLARRSVSNQQERMMTLLSE